jgi:hypothetical protein
MSIEGPKQNNIPSMPDGVRHALERMHNDIISGDLDTQETLSPHQLTSHKSRVRRTIIYFGAMTSGIVGEIAIFTLNEPKWIQIFPAIAIGLGGIGLVREREGFVQEVRQNQQKEKP